MLIFTLYLYTEHFRCPYSYDKDEYNGLNAISQKTEGTRVVKAWDTRSLN